MIMTTELYNIVDFMIEAFIHIWPYLIITIPIAVAVNMSGASKHIKRAFDARPTSAILLATIVGAFSPFCSCGVIPVIAALLIGGVPLPPVMAFWIASPSMDPEIFFLSVGTIGWDLAIWRLLGTLVMSLSAGFITQVLMQVGWISPDILKRKTGLNISQKLSKTRQTALFSFLNFKNLFSFKAKSLVPVQVSACCSEGISSAVQIQPSPAQRKTNTQEVCTAGGSYESCECPEDDPFLRRLGKESMGATLMVIKFMALAFFLEALIILYVPQEWITNIMGKDNTWAILTATFLGIPAYKIYRFS